MSIKLNDLFSNDVFSSEPYQKPNSVLFFRYCQSNNIQEVKNMIKKNKYLVYDIDNVKIKKIVFHDWAAHRLQKGLLPTIRSADKTQIAHRRHGHHGQNPIAVRIAQ